jgi:hypothetical protein
MLTKGCLSTSKVPNIQIQEGPDILLTKYINTRQQLQLVLTPPPHNLVVDCRKIYVLLLFFPADGVAVAGMNDRRGRGLFGAKEQLGALRRQSHGVQHEPFG